ncbi:hypothetical protein KSC_065490 [Ktedonobacter sp. SOSP1-52]|nr:hypothetical protein KSC_065490 [Ktedonobacter sp. SOSP1-52]
MLYIYVAFVETNDARVKYRLFAHPAYRTIYKRLLLTLICGMKTSNDVIMLRFQMSGTGELSWGRKLINDPASGSLLGAIGESCETTLSYCVFGGQMSYRVSLVGLISG